MVSRRSGYWMRPVLPAVLYDVKQAKGDKAAQQKLVDEVMANVVNEHYFSYVFDTRESSKLNTQNTLKITACV